MSAIRGYPPSDVYTLEYIKLHKQHDPTESDGLVVMARGLGTRQVLLTLLKIHANPKNLVLLLNTEKKDLQMLRDDLIEAALETDIGGDNVPSIMVDCFKEVNADTLVQERASLYLSGGVIAVTSRILVVDMLNKSHRDLA